MSPVQVINEGFVECSHTALANQMQFKLNLTDLSLKSSKPSQNQAIGPTYKHYRVTEAYDALSPCSEWDGERIHKEHGTILALC